MVQGPLDRALSANDLIENRDLRLANISEKVNLIIVYYGVYTLFCVALLLQIRLMPESRLFMAFSVVILYHLAMAYKGYLYVLRRQIRQRVSFKKSEGIIGILENVLYVLFWTAFAFYIKEGPATAKVDGMLVLSPALAACVINIFCLKYDETPCNATFFLVMKVVLFLRAVTAFSILIKIDGKTQWDWSTTFWPYWCSFAIQGIMAIASLIIFLNTLLSYLKEDTGKSDGNLFIPY